MVAIGREVDADIVYLAQQAVGNKCKVKIKLILPYRRTSEHIKTLSDLRVRVLGRSVPDAERHMVANDEGK